MSVDLIWIMLSFMGVACKITDCQSNDQVIDRWIENSTCVHRITDLKQRA